MPNKTNISQNQTIAEPEMGNSGVEHSRAQAVESKDSTASINKMISALEKSNTIIEQLRKENLLLKSENSSIDKFTKSIEALVTRNVNPQPIDPLDNINRVNNFNNKTQVDGRSLVEAQEALYKFKQEPTKPINIPKALAAEFGPYVAVTVNGVRLAVPCDGKTYFINETHYEHIKERIAKVDKILQSDSSEVIVKN